MPNIQKCVKFCSLKVQQRTSYRMIHALLHFYHIADVLRHDGWKMVFDFPKIRFCIVPLVLHTKQHAIHRNKCWNKRYYYAHRKTASMEKCFSFSINSFRVFLRYAINENDKENSLVRYKDIFLRAKRSKKQQAKRHKKTEEKRQIREKIQSWSIS